MQEVLGSEWSFAKLDAVFYPDCSHYYGEYVPNTEGLPRSFAPTFEAQALFREVRDRFSSSGQPLWGQATFMLWSSGNFSLTFGYANCDNNGDTQFNEDAFLEFERRRFERLTQ